MIDPRRDRLPPAGNDATFGVIVYSSMSEILVRRWNAGRRINLHAIGVGDDHDVAFPGKRSEQNGGLPVARWPARR